MKKFIIFFVTTLCIIGMCSCGSTNAVPEPTESLSEPVQSTVASEPAQNTASNAAEEEKALSQEDILSLFSACKKPQWQYISSVLIPDHAADRIGAVLFWDSEEETTNVAFFNEEGYYMKCGIYSKILPGTVLTYLGNGAVSFLTEEDGKTYQYTITLSIDGADVNFKVESTQQET